ncbi:MAG: hypothetical protein WC718_01530 [Phycisphaerales bacterium]|jgi:hypothetical protein
MESYFAFAAFVLFWTTVYGAANVALQIARNRRLERQVDEWVAKFNEQAKILERFRKFDPDGNDFPGGRKRHDPYIDR